MPAPLFRIVRGEPDDTEVAAAAAAVLLLASRGDETEPDEAATRSGWGPEYACCPPGTWASS